MSQTSGGDKWWRCTNSACNHPPDIPLSVGITFRSCPYCRLVQESMFQTNESRQEVTESLQRATLHLEADLVERASNLAPNISESRTRTRTQESLENASQTPPTSRNVLQVQFTPEARHTGAIKPTESHSAGEGNSQQKPSNDPPGENPTSDSKGPPGTSGKNLSPGSSGPPGETPKLDSSSPGKNPTPDNNGPPGTLISGITDNLRDHDASGAGNKDSNPTGNPKGLQGDVSKPQSSPDVQREHSTLDNDPVHKRSPVRTFCNTHLLTPSARFCADSYRASAKHTPKETITSQETNLPSNSSRNQEASSKTGTVKDFLTRFEKEENVRVSVPAVIPTSNISTETAMGVNYMLKKNPRKRTIVTNEQFFIKRFKPDDCTEIDPLLYFSSDEPNKMSEAAVSDAKNESSTSPEIEARVDLNPSHSSDANMLTYKKDDSAGNLFEPTENKKFKKKKKGKHFGTMSEEKSATSDLGTVSGNQGATVNLVFHVIIPKQFWEWDDQSYVSLRFGNPELGSWKKDCGDFSQLHVTESLFEMTCQLELSVELLNLQIPYKYVVFTEKSLTKKDGWYEFIRLPERTRGDLNRALNLSQGEIQQATVEGVYHQYDSMVFPSDVLITRDLGERFMSGVRSLLLWGKKNEATSKDNLEVPEYYIILQNCLMFYIDANYRAIISTGQFSESFPLAIVVRRVYHIFTCLLESQFIYQEGPRIKSFKPSFRKQPLQEAIVRVLNSAITTLPNGETKQLMCAIFILSCISELDIPFYTEGFQILSSKLLRLMCAYGEEDGFSEKWSELKQVFKNGNNRRRIGGIASRMLKYISEQQATNLEWMYGLPLHNFLMENSEPFDSINSMSVDVLMDNWKKLSQKFPLLNIRGKLAGNRQLTIMKQYYPSMLFLMKMDPLTLQAFVFICPDHELDNLLALIPPHVATTWVSYLLHVFHYRPSTKDEVTMWAGWLSVIQKNITSYLESDPLHLVESTVLLFERCTASMKSSDDHCLQVLKTVISNFLESIACYSYVCTANIPIIQTKIEATQKLLRSWLSSEKVVGGNMFGNHPVYYEKNCLLMSHVEVKIWKSFLSVKCSSNTVETKWQQAMEVVLKERLSKVPPGCAVTLLKNVESNSQEHEILKNAVMDVATKGAEHVFFEQPDRALKSFTDMISTDSKLLGVVLGKVLKKQYPDLNSYWITLDVLLDWVLWPNYLKIVHQGSESLLKDGLPEECRVVCACASSKFEEICNRLEKANVSFKELRKMKDKEKQVQRLCEAVTESENSQLSYEKVVCSLNQRLKEFSHFSRRRQAYLEICKWILNSSNPKQSTAGILELKREMENNFDHMNISDLCQLDDDDQLQLCCLKSAQPLDVFVDNFAIMMRKSPIIFARRLTKKLKEVLATLDTKITVNEIFSKIWQPAFTFCQNLLTNLADRSMKLDFVDKHLTQFSKHLSNNVNNLAEAIRSCSQPIPQSHQLQSAVKKVHDYWRLCRYEDGARVFLQLKDVLNLKGDFSLIEKYFSVQLKESMKDQTIDAIDDTLVDTGDFLKEIVDHPSKHECLKVFGECQGLIKWLRKFTTSVNDIQGFVTIALATAAGGEDDLASDKLSHLRNVGSGYASLIYEVNELDGYKKLKDRCKSLWDALEKNPNLPELLVSCNDDIEWYKSVKETQGSVETTSYGQMSNILKYGTYRVGFKKNAQTVHDLISVTLSRQKVVKWKYSLDELRDLESKLVLICGNKAENRAEVDDYLNLLHSATRIAELYLDLQKAGEVTYTDVSLTFRCAVFIANQPGDDDVQFNEAKAKITLQNYIRALDRQLIAWKDSVNNARGKYYELNYFTTIQLLQLRKELGMLTQSNATHIVKPNVLMLLKSISPQVDSRVVVDAMQASTHATQPEPMDYDGEMEAITTATAITTPTDVEVMESSPAFEKQDPQQFISSPSAALKLPSLMYENLTEHQQETYTHCVNFFGYSKRHVLRAFKECGKEATIYDIEPWCVSNEDITPDEERSVGPLEMEEDKTDIYDPLDDSDSDKGMDTTRVLSESQASTVSAAELEGPLSNFSLQIKTVVTVDESHPGVQELVEAGYELQDCVEAIEQSLGDMQEAIKLLDAREMGEGAQPGIFVHSKSKEEEPNWMEDQVAEADEDHFIEHRGSDAGSSYLPLDDLGRVLKSISTLVPGAVDQQRSFNTTYLNAGHPNLLVTAPDDVLSSVLALYTEDHTLPLPTQEEVLLCTCRTTTEEVSLLWRRAIDDPEYKRVFCLAHAERLSYQVCDAALRSLEELSQGKTRYHLVVICGKEKEDTSHIISRLHFNRREVVPTLVVDNCREYLKAHFVHQMDMELDCQVTPISDQRASMVDPENSCVRVVSSTRSGMGKSLYVKKISASLRKAISNDGVHVTIPIHGPVVTADTLMDYFKNYAGRDNSTIYHLDIAPRVLAEVDCILFSLLILSGLNDSRGLVWRSHASHLYIVEVTLPEKTTHQESFQTLNLLNLLPTVHCTSPRDVALTRQQQLGADVLGMDDNEFKGATIQRVYQYLRRHAGGHNLDTFSYQGGSVEGKVQDCLKIILSKCGIRDPSWAEIHYFVKFLDIQLNLCENSVFCNEALVGDVMSGLKGFVVKFMIRMSQDFSTPSLEGVLARENLEEGVPAVAAADDNDQLEQYQIVERRQWEQNSHPYIFFNEDNVSITFVGFKVTQNGDLVDPAHKTVLESAIMTQQLYTGLKQNGVNFDEDYRGWSKAQMITKITTVMGFKFIDDPDGTYVFTTDNLIKMLAIQMRFRCDIPVVIMGETGCGKTRLIRYMCDLARGGRDLKNMLILKIHGGITDLDVTKFVEYAEETARTNKAVDPRLSTVVFFDEANTTDSIGLIKEIMCDRRINGQPLSNNLKFIAACNPYKKHSKEMIRKLEVAGLGFYVRETQQKLGEIPLRQLVYRVLELPPSMCPLIYDFGQLNTATECDYTSQIVKDHVHGHPSLCNESPAIIPAISKVLTKSQKFMRDQKNECSFVSLRDVERAMIVFEYFYEKMDRVFAPLINKRAEEAYNEYVDSDNEDDEAAVLPPRLNNVTIALILSLSVCYRARLQDREPYEEHIAACFNNPLLLHGGDERFRDEIRWCEEGLLDNMVLGPNIAKNAALRENVFMMAICIELRIPLFLVGKPGSSKSLAKSIIQDSMHGPGSRSPVLRDFKQVHMFSYQCSQLSTPESVIEVFKAAEKFQAKQDIKQYVSVVVLDEVGLAEDSPSLPLKALHPLLEDGTDGSGKDHQQQTVEREKRVAFIGISNWALDPAKMNRGVMVTRGDPEKNDLELSAEGICSNADGKLIKEQLHRYFAPLSEAYMNVCNICKKQKRQFFGLRDFYSLIKMLYWMCEKSGGHPLSWLQLNHAIRRNFGGLESKEINPLEEFSKAITDYFDDNQDFSGLDDKMLSILKPDCSPLGLIKTSLYTKDTTTHGENRYLLFLTENYAALDILKHYVRGEGANDSDLTSQPYILFGSSFPKDKGYTQVCRNINQIKICMETGRTVILLNLENLYESLYDVLNQYYMYSGGVRYVDLGLQTHRVKCRVHPNFKLILIAEKDTVYEKFPTPLINRLEKHFVLTSSVLEEWQSDILEDFNTWIQDFSNTRGNHFSEAHAFIGYQKDTPAAVVFQATNLLKRLQRNPSLSSKIEQLQRAGIISENFVGLSENSPQWSDSVLKLSQFLLLQTAADDAIIRLRKSDLLQEDIECLTSWYFKHQYHTSIGEFLQYECSRHNREVFLQVTTHCRLMTREELTKVTDAVGMDFAHFDLHEFDSELDFSNKIGPKFIRDDVDDAKPFLVIVQCDSGHLNSDLIACARYRVCDEAIRAKDKNKIHGGNNIDVTRILFVIHLPQQEVKSQFVGFQGDPWISVHIDDLRATSEITVIPEQALNASISELFIGKLREKNQERPDLEESDEQELKKGSDSYFRIETGEEDSEGEMFHSAEHSHHMRDDDIYSDQDMSDEASVPDTPQRPSISSLEEVNRMDTESNEPHVELAYRDSALNDEASNMMDIEDAQLFDPLLIDVAVPPVEADKLPSDTMQISLPPSEEIESIVPTSPIKYSDDDNAEPTPLPMKAHSIAEVPTVQKEVPSFHSQHHRLLGCVQAAVSMLKDTLKDRAKHRILKLMSLIPKTHPGEAPFYDLLVKLIHSALLQRESDRVDEREWVLNEAMSGRKLQNGGTFRNVLARRIDEVITPYFAEIIAHVDQNCNLDLLDSKDLNSPVSRLWLTIFKFTGGRIDFSSLAEGKTTIKNNFQCQFPFSWFVKDMVNAQRANMLDTEQHLHNSLCEALSLTDMGTILGSVDEDHVDKFYKLYLYDFVRYIHKSSHKSELGNMEYKLIMNALDNMTHHNDFCSVDGHESLSRKIVALHLVHGQCSSKVLQFGQIVLHRPSILRSLSNKDSFRVAGQDFALHLYAVQRVLESDQEYNDPTSQDLAGLNPPLHKTNQDDLTRDLQRWLNHVRLSQNVIDTILRSSSGDDTTIMSRLTWQRIRALQIFAEKVYLPHCKVDGMRFIIRRLALTLKSHSDFLKEVTVKEVKKILNAVFNFPKLKADNITKKKIRKSCNRFFIEVVSSLCFGGMEAPETELVKLLLDTVLRDNQTSRLSPYNDEQQDETPTIRSFLLQLLLEHEHDQVKQYLDEYFKRSIAVIRGHGMDQGLCLLCIQCFEDSLRKRINVLPAQSRASYIERILGEGYLVLQEYFHTPSVSLQYLESVAGVRLSLSVLAQELKSDRVNSSLLRVARDLCMDTRVNVIDPKGRVDTTGPVLYLMRLLVRQFGFPCLQTVSQAHPWVVPETLRRVDNEEKSIDLSVLYEQGYKDVRIAVNTALYSNETTELAACVEDGAEVCLLAFAFYQKATLSRASTAPAVQIEAEALQLLNTFVQNYPTISPELLQVLRLLLANQQGGTLAQMVVSPHQAQAGLHRSITGLVVHIVTVLLSRTNNELLLPFLNMLTNPTLLKNAYLPTMPEDMLQEVRQAGGGTFYECPNGHPYLVGECGRPVELKTCRECGASIGGTSHKLRSDNRTARVNDTTKTGHDLGAPQQRTVNSERERTLSATAVNVVRVLMHASFLWAACHDQQLELIVEVVKGVRPQDLAEFFWFHLVKDLECMQRSTGRGMDECVMIMHLVLKEILGTNPSISCGKSNQLQNKIARKEWERQFNITYVEPVLNQLEVAMAKALDLVANDDQQDQDRLFYLAYEKVKVVDEGKLEVHFWSYRPQICLEHLKSAVQAGNECKILDTFLQNEPSLRATQYIPDIVRLQQFMFETFDRRLDKSKAETMTIREFLKEVKDTRNENTKNECQEMIENLKKAWTLVGQKLKNHNRLPVEEKYLITEIKDKTPLVYLIPTTMREGRCTTALVDYLVLTHNDFIEKCRGIVSQGSESSASAVWKEHKVPITHVHRCHLLEYEQHLQSIILSHCHYSLTVGSGQNIKYDLPALEKHILNRFIYGKPAVLLDIHCVAYRKDIYTAETFQEIRRKVKPQIRLRQRIQQDIITDLRTPDKLKESLDVVDIVLGLLSSGGASDDVRLEKYILSTKMGNKPFSAKAKEHCTLGHILSLWETISVELARQLWHTGQEPFEGIPEGYSADLSTDQLNDLNKCLRTFDLALLLGSLFEFIEVHVKHITANEEDFALVESLELYWDMTEQSPIDLDRLDEFPESITVPQAVAMWKHVAEYKENRH
ncbi:E3 ubiquitin-protein ligase RNF213-like isoform X2 [Halichondria panicea]|uniref:E3 ubiquitin-protein ligase RNF213-like isoform X2 n=1 Tax=Halichondria panicea TaxID=6063 RepID=UPI00312BB8C0